MEKNKRNIKMIQLFLCLWVVFCSHHAHCTEAVNCIEGVVRPAHRIKMNSQVTGKVVSIRVKEGDHVREGDLLIRLDDTLQKAAVDKASLQVEDIARSRAAEFRLAEAKVVLEQLKSAYLKDAAAEWEVRRAELQVNLAEMEVRAETEERAKNKKILAAEEARLFMHSINSPVSGIVRKIMVDPGQTVSPSDPVIEIVDLSYLKAEFFLPINWYEKLTVGKKHVLRAGDPVNRSLTAKLETMDKAMDSASQTFRAIFHLQNPQNKLPSGFQIWFSPDEAKQCKH